MPFFPHLDSLFVEIRSLGILDQMSVTDGQGVCAGCVCRRPCLRPQLAVDVDRRPHRLLKSVRRASLCCAQSDEHSGYLAVCGGAV